MADNKDPPVPKKSSLEWAKERAAQAQARAAGPAGATVQLPPLPLWPDAVRAVPNGIDNTYYFIWRPRLDIEVVAGVS